MGKRWECLLCQTQFNNNPYINQSQPYALVHMIPSTHSSGTIHERQIRWWSYDHLWISPAGGGFGGSFCSPVRPSHETGQGETENPRLAPAPWQKLQPHEQKIWHSAINLKNLGQESQAAGPGRTKRSFPSSEAAAAAGYPLADNRERG